MDVVGSVGRRGKANKNRITNMAGMQAADCADERYEESGENGTIPGSCYR